MMWRYCTGNSIAIYNSASSGKTMHIVLMMVFIGMPLAGLYTSFVFRTFTGKVKPGKMSY